MPLPRRFLIAAAKGVTSESSLGTKSAGGSQVLHNKSSLTCLTLIDPNWPTRGCREGECVNLTDAPPGRPHNTSLNIDILVIFKLEFSEHKNTHKQLIKTISIKNRVSTIICLLCLIYRCSYLYIT